MVIDASALLAVLLEEPVIPFCIDLGDCFAYALAVTENLPQLTLDSDFRAVDISVIHRPASSEVYASTLGLPPCRSWVGRAMRAFPDRDIQYAAMWREDAAYASVVSQ